MTEKRGLKALEEWCRRVTQGHKDVSIRNMTSSWRDGLAFCAIIHHYCPELINYDALSKENIFQNNDTAFSVAEKELGIPALLEAADMVECEEPDPLSIATYLSQLYQYFEGKDGAGNIVGAPKIGLPQLTTVLQGKRLYSRDNTGPPRVHQTCQACDNRVFILERLIVDSKLYHRTCFSCHKCQALLQPGAYVEGEAEGQYECAVCPAEEKPQRPPTLSPSSSSASLSSVDDDAKSFESASQDASSSPRLPRLSQDQVDLSKTVRAELEFAQSVTQNSQPEQSNGQVEERRRSDEVELSQLISKPPLPSKPNFLFTKTRFGPLDKKSESRSGEALAVASLDSETTTPEAPESDYSQPFRPPRLKSTLRHQQPTSKLPDIPIIFSPTYQLNRVHSENSVVRSKEMRHLVGGDSRELEQMLRSKPTPLRHTSLTDLSVLKLNQASEADQSQAAPPPSESKVALNSSADAEPAVEQTTSSGDNPATEKVQAEVQPNELQPSKSYPEDLNPFPEEEEERKEEDYPEELNPFGSDDNEVKAPVQQTPPVVKVSANDYDSSLNPFGDVDDEEPPKPTPPRTPVNRVVSSPTGSISSNRSAPGALKKRRAPLPPAMKPTAGDTPSAKAPQQPTPEWKKKKRPAPPAPIPPRRLIKKIPVEEIHREMEDINGRLKELERRGRDLETSIRDKPRAEEPSPEDEERINTFFELMNEKNALFRRQAELMYIKRYQRLEEEQAELDHQLRCIINKPRPQKTEEDLKKEEELLQRILEVVEQRNEVVESIDLDRKRFQEDKLMPSRETQEELIMSERLLEQRSAADHKPKKEKKKKKKKKEKSPKEGKLKKKWLGVL